MEIKLVQKLGNYNIIILKRWNKKVNLNMKIWKSLNIHNKIFDKNVNCNQKIKRTLMKIKFILILKDNGLLF